MKTSKKASKAKAVRKPAAKAKKPPAKAAKAAKTASPRAAKTAKPAAAAPRAKPVHEWAEAIKKAALQNKQGHQNWPGGGDQPWKGKQRPE